MFSGVLIKVKWKKYVLLRNTNLWIYSRIRLRLSADFLPHERIDNVGSVSCVKRGEYYIACNTKDIFCCAQGFILRIAEQEGPADRLFTNYVMGKIFWCSFFFLLFFFTPSWKARRLCPIFINISPRGVKSQRNNYLHNFKIIKLIVFNHKSLWLCEWRITRDKYHQKS